MLINLSKKSIAKNTIFNLLGYGIPILFALILIPPLIRGLGTERFGILNLVWIVIGYFSFLDLGIGRSLTKVVAEKIGMNQTEQIPVIFWTSLILMLAISLIVTGFSIFFIPSLLNQYLIISDSFKPETYRIFFVVALSVPIITTSAGLRGVLEAYQKFAQVNLIRAFLGIATFLGPFIVLLFTNSLFWIVLFLIFVRLIIWILYLILCFHTNKNIREEINFDFLSIKPLLKFSLWISMANIIGPIILYSDRFLIGAIVSASAITYYATPYEIITKLLIIPSALVTVLFPVFSANFLTNPELSKGLFLKGVKYIFLIIYPMILTIIIFANEGMTIWLGSEFSQSSAYILQLLSVGILMNCLSLIPNIFFQGSGMPKIPTLINLIELPFYLVIMWYSINKWEIIGAASTYMFMATIDAIIMFLMSFKIFSIKINSKMKIGIILSMLILLISFQINGLPYKVVFILSFMVVFGLVSWKYILEKDERYIILAKMKSMLNG